jgi:hypothetical protein
MIKKLLIVFILLPLFGFSQNIQALREQAEVYYQKGDFLKSYKILNSIKDKNVLENTNVNLYKANLEDIMNHRFFKSIKLNDSLSKVYIKTKVLKSQGIYNTKSNQYTIPPVYDSIAADVRYYSGVLNAFKDNQATLLNIQTGKIIIPLGNYFIDYHQGYVVVDSKSKFGFFYNEDNLDVYDFDGNLLFKNLNSFKMLDANLLLTKNKNNKYQLLNIKTKEVVLDDCDFIYQPTYATFINDVEYNNRWLPFTKDGKNYLYKYSDNGIENTHKFDTYIAPYSYSFNTFENGATKIINEKNNATSCPDIETHLCFNEDYAIVIKDNKYGIFNVTKDNFYKEPIYDSIDNIGNTFYNGKWINLIYSEEIRMPEGDRYQVVIYKKNNLFGLLDAKGNNILEANYDEITNGYGYGVYHLRKGTKWGFVCTVGENNKLVPPQFDFITGSQNTGNNIGHIKRKSIEYFSNGTIANLSDKEKKQLKNQIGKKYKEQQNSTALYDLELEKSQRLIFEKDGKYGLDDFNNHEIVAGKYTFLEQIGRDLFIATSGSLKGLIDGNGNELIPIKYVSLGYKSFNNNVLFVSDSKGLEAIFTNKGVMLYPFKIKKIIDIKFGTNSKTEFFKVTEITDDTTKGFDAENAAFQKNVVLKIKNEKLERLDFQTNYFSFLQTNYLVYGIQQNFGFYNLDNGKMINPEFKGDIIDNIQSHRIFARKGLYYDTLIDSSGTVTTLERPFFEMKNDNFFYQENNKIGVMNKDFKTANFKYPVLKNMTEFGSDYYANYSKEYKEIASSYFKFNTDINSNKNGLINFDGTIITEPEKYDDVQLFYLGRNNYNSNVSYYAENEYLKKYEERLFIGTNYKKDSKIIQLISNKKENIAEFELKKNENWNFTLYNNTIIIKSQDSVKLYDLKTKKFQLKIKSNQFREERDFGYTSSNFDYKANKNKFEKYDHNGKLIFDTIMDSNKQYYAISDENYIFKNNSNKYGTKNSRGKTGIPFIYDYLESKNAKLFISKKNDLYGIIDADNQTIVDQKYQDIKLLEIKDRYTYNKIAYSGYMVKENEKYGFLDLNTKTLLPSKFDEIKVYERFITGKKDSLVTVYQLTGKEIFTAKVDSINMDQIGNYGFYKKGKRVYRKDDGTITDKDPFITSEDRIKIEHSKLIDSKYYLSKNDNILYKTPIVSVVNIGDFEDYVKNRWQYLLIKDENNQYGLYTDGLKEILPFAYTEIILARNAELFIVKKDNKYGVINLKNEVLIPFEYDKILSNDSRYFNCTKNKRSYKITPQNKIIYIDK